MLRKINDKQGQKVPAASPTNPETNSGSDEDGEEEDSEQASVDENEQSVTAGLTLEMMEKELKALMMPSAEPEDDNPAQDPLVSKSEVRNQLTMKLVCQYCLVDAENLSQDEKYEKALELQELQLMLLRIPRIENLELFTNCIKLNLSRNYIRKIEGLEMLFKLEKLYLQNNLIENVENLKDLKKLTVLDLSHNKIEKLALEQYPSKLQSLNLSGNPVDQTESTRQLLVDKLTELKVYNSTVVLPSEAASARGLIRPELQAYQQKMETILSRYKDSKLGPMPAGTGTEEVASYARETEGLMDEADRLATRMKIQHEMERDVMHLGFEARMQALQDRLAYKKEIYAAQKAQKK